MFSQPSKFNDLDYLRENVKCIKNNTKKIALIDDLAEHGWNEALSQIFGEGKIENFIATAEFREKSRRWKNFDIICLDLRVDEKNGENEKTFY